MRESFIRPMYLLWLFLGKETLIINCEWRTYETTWAAMNKQAQLRDNCLSICFCCSSNSHRNQRWLFHHRLALYMYLWRLWVSIYTYILMCQYRYPYFLNACFTDFTRNHWKWERGTRLVQVVCYHFLYSHDLNVWFSCDAVRRK